MPLDHALQAVRSVEDRAVREHIAQRIVKRRAVNTVLQASLRDEQGADVERMEPALNVFVHLDNPVLHHLKAYKCVVNQRIVMLEQYYPVGGRTQWPKRSTAT